MASVSKSEHQRDRRRRSRIAAGMVATLFMIIGVISVIRSVSSGVIALFDDSEARAAYAIKVEGFVKFDPAPFDDVDRLDSTTLQNAAVWGTISNILTTYGSMEAYDHDEETGEVFLPVVEVDAFMSQCLGPDFVLPHETFVSGDMTIEYIESLQCYRIPVTGSVGNYTATVTKLFRQDGLLHVTVGYIPTQVDTELTASAASEPTKYMDYLFHREGRNWYLKGLTTSETKAPSSSSTTTASSNSATATEPDAALEEQIRNDAGNEGGDSSLPAQSGSGADASQPERDSPQQ